MIAGAHGLIDGSAGVHRVGCACVRPNVIYAGEKAISKRERNAVTVIAAIQVGSLIHGDVLGSERSLEACKNGGGKANQDIAELGFTVGSQVYPCSTTYHLSVA